MGTWGSIIVASASLCLVSASGRGDDADVDYLKYRIPADAAGREAGARAGEPYAKEVKYRSGGTLVGIRQFRADGSLHAEMLFKNKKRHGIQRVWHENGQVKFDSPVRTRCTAVSPPLAKQE